MNAPTQQCSYCSTRMERLDLHHTEEECHQQRTLDLFAQLEAALLSPDTTETS